jgi:hypothetical protein
MARPRKAETSRITIHVKPEVKARLEKQLAGEYGAQSDKLGALIEGWLDQKEGEQTITLNLGKEHTDALKRIMKETDQDVDFMLKRLIMQEVRTYTEGGGQRQRIEKVQIIQKLQVSILQDLAARNNVTVTLTPEEQAILDKIGK